MDDLVKRLASWGTAAGLSAHFLGTKSAREDCAEAAAALTEAQATIARQQVMLDRALQDVGDKMVEIGRLREALEPFAEAAEECDDYRYDDENQAPVTAGRCREARAALEAKHG